jgi:hypothetical protein
MAARTVTFQGFQTVSRWHPEIVQAGCGIQQLESVQRLLLASTWKPSGALLPPDPLGFLAGEADDQRVPNCEAGLYSSNE